MLNEPSLAQVTVFSENCLRDELRYREKLKTHLQVYFQPAALGVPTKKHR